jgi:hypothetical protein
MVCWLMTKQRHILFNDGVKLERPKLDDWFLRSIVDGGLAMDFRFLKFFTKETQSILKRHITSVAKFELELRHRERFSDIVNKEVSDVDT